MDLKPRKERSDKGMKKIIHKCEICGKIEKQKKSLLDHHLIYHASEEERKEKYTYYCNKCKVGYFIESIYKKHIESNKHKRLNNDKE